MDERVTLEDAVTALLREQELTVTTVESCTGGLLAGRLVNVPGVSEVFKQGFVTYSNEAKQRVLGVKEETLRQYGAVSRETAEEMAAGGAAAAGTSACVAITGLAGPGGGSPEKPVGLVYLAVESDAFSKVIETHYGRKDKDLRELIRHRSTLAALDLIMKAAKAASSQ